MIPEKLANDYSVLYKDDFSMSYADVLDHELAAEIVKRYNAFDERKEALQLCKGVMPFHDGDFTVGESKAMLAIETILNRLQ